MLARGAKLVPLRTTLPLRMGHTKAYLTGTRLIMESGMRACVCVCMRV